MANTYTRLLYHCVWSTKNRESLIHRKIEDRVWAFLAGIAAKNNMHPLKIGGIENHVHALIEIPKTLAIPAAVKILKGGVSSWINAERLTATRFQWQDGYAAFSVSASKISAIDRYIANQREHHRHQSFEDEYRMFLKRNGVHFESRYAFG